jgi:hypothetical protein
MKRFAQFIVIVAHVGYAGFANAQWWKPNNTVPAAQPVTYTRETVADAKNAIEAAFRSGDFDKIDKMHAEFSQMNHRANDGTWMIQSFEWAFDALFYVQNVEANQKKFDEWKAKVPDSKFRDVAQAAMWQRHAWSVRGGQVGSRVPDEAMEIFKEWMGNATKSLNAAGESGKSSPIWHWVALIVAGSSGQSDAEMDLIFKEATRRFPTYQPLYYTRMNYLLPQWGGNYAAVDKFILSSQRFTEKYDGRSFYAWLYLYIAKWQKADFFVDTKVTWPLLKAGFEDLVKRYPDNMNLNLFGTFACRARDRETTARVLQQLGANARLGFYSPGISVESCTRMISEKT